MRKEAVELSWSLHYILALVYPGRQLTRGVTSIVLVCEPLIDQVDQSDIRLHISVQFNSIQPETVIDMLFTPKVERIRFPTYIHAHTHTYIMWCNTTNSMLKLAHLFHVKARKLQHSGT